VAKREGGRGVVSFAWPGAEGHDRCRTVCLTYGCNETDVSPALLGPAAVLSEGDSTAVAD